MPTLQAPAFLLSPLQLECHLTMVAQGTLANPHPASTFLSQQGEV